MSAYPKRMTTHFFDPMGESTKLGFTAPKVAQAMVALRGRNGLYSIAHDVWMQDTDGAIRHIDPFSPSRLVLNQLFRLAAFDRPFPEAYDTLMVFEENACLQFFAADFHQVGDEDPSHIFNIDLMTIGKQALTGSWRVPSFPPVS